MDKIQSFVTTVTFGYRSRQWIAGIRKVHLNGKTHFAISYQPAATGQPKGYVEIVPPSDKTKTNFWKQKRSKGNDNELNPEFIALLAKKIIEWQGEFPDSH